MKKLILILLILAFTLPGCNGKKNAEQLLEMAQKSYDQGKYFEARKYLGQALKLKPTDKDIVFQIGRTYMAENMFDSAFANLSRADKLYPNDREINLLLHDASVKSRHWRAAIAALLTLSRTGDPIENYYRQIGQYALNDSAGHIAYYYYGKLMELEPDSLSHYLNRAEGGFIKGTPEETIEVLKAALKEFGDKPVILAPLGRVYLVSGKLVEAEEIYRLLISKEKNTYNELQLATVLSLQDLRSKRQEALAMFRRLRDEAINIRRVDSVINMLEQELK